VPGTGGLRKLRWAEAQRGKGKRGGIQVIYYWYEPASLLYMLLAYSKSERDDISAEEKRALRKLITEEFKLKKELFNELVESIKEAGKIHRGELKPSREFTFEPADVRAIRAKLHKSQSEFAQMIGVSVATLQNWEQGRRQPEGPARALLLVASKAPTVVAKALAKATTRRGA
jgi:putative transcriptional regulator